MTGTELRATAAVCVAARLSQRGVREAVLRHRAETWASGRDRWRREHAGEQALDGHRVRADGLVAVEVAAADQGAAFDADIMVVVVAVDGDGEAGEAEAAALLGVAVGLLDLANHTGVQTDLLQQTTTPRMTRGVS